MKEFLVVEFVDDEDCSVAVICKSWYQQTHDEYGIVRWTPSRNVSLAVQKRLHQQHRGSASMQNCYLNVVCSKSEFALWYGTKISPHNIVKFL